MVVNVALIVSSQSSMACWGGLSALLIFISVSLSVLGLSERGQSGWSIDISMLYQSIACALALGGQGLGLFSLGTSMSMVKSSGFASWTGNSF